MKKSLPFRLASRAYGAVGTEEPYSLSEENQESNVSYF